MPPDDGALGRPSAVPAGRGLLVAGQNGFAASLAASLQEQNVGHTTSPSRRCGGGARDGDDVVPEPFAPSRPSLLYLFNCRTCAPMDGPCSMHFC